MEIKQIEERIERLEKQAKICRFVTYGLLAFMIPIFLIGHVSAKNEVFNAYRIVANEFVLSKDGNDVGKWFVDKNNEATLSMYKHILMSAP